MSMSPQCEQLLHARQQVPMNTGEIRFQLGIGVPATRVFELKEMGYNIRTTMLKVKNRFGHRTSVAQYTLVDMAAQVCELKQAA